MIAAVAAVGAMIAVVAATVGVTTDCARGLFCSMPRSILLKP
jgi:hypothetical protein